MIELFRDAWDKCRTMSKEAAMTAYIDEIRKVNRERERISSEDETDYFEDLGNNATNE